MSHTPKLHIESASPTGSSKRTPNTWNSILNNEHAKNPSDKVILEKSEEKPLERLSAKRNFASKSPGSRLLRSRVPGSTPTIDLDGVSDACPNTSSVPPVTHAAIQLGPAANLSSSESDDDENEHSTQPIAKTSPRKSSRVGKKLRRASSSLSLDSCDSEALNPEPSSAKKYYKQSKSVGKPGQMGTNQVMGLGSTQRTTTGSNSGQRPESLVKKQKLVNCASGSNRGAVKDVGSRATALLLQQQEENLLRKANNVPSRAAKPANAKSSNSPPVGKCLLCNTHGVLIADQSICRFNCRASANKTSVPTANVVNSPGTKSTVKMAAGNASRVNQNWMEPRLSSPLSRGHVPISKATTKPSKQSSSEANVLGKRDANGEPKPPMTQALQNGARHSAPRKKISLINLPTIRENDAAGKDRFHFFACRPKRFDFPRDSSMAKFSPFASAAESMEGVSSTDVCSVCGSSGSLVACERCPLAFHKHCHWPPMKDSESEGFLCRACKSVKGNDKSKAYMPAVRPEPLPPPWKPLARLAADAAQGNPVDMVLHPSLHNDFICLYKTDWLRCNRCNRLRIVGQRSLSESVHIPFECADAFWTTADQRSCGAVLSASEQSQLKYAFSKMRERSKRRARLFYHKFGEKDRTSYGFLSPDEVVVLDDADDAAPPDPARKRTVALCSTPSPRPSVIESQSQTVNAPVGTSRCTSKAQAPGAVLSSSSVRPPSSPVHPAAPNKVSPENTKKVVSRNDLAKGAENDALNSNRSTPSGLPSGAGSGVQRSTAPYVSSRSSQLANAPGQQRRQPDGLGVSVPFNSTVPTHARRTSPSSQVPTAGQQQRQPDGLGVSSPIISTVPTHARRASPTSQVPTAGQQQRQSDGLGVSAPIISTVPTHARRASPTSQVPTAGQQQRQPDGLGVSAPVMSTVPTHARRASPISQVPTTALSNAEQSRATSLDAVAPLGPIQEQSSRNPTGVSLPISSHSGVLPQRALVSSTPVQNVPIVSNAAASSEVVPRSRELPPPLVLVHNNSEPSAANHSQAVPLNPVQNVVLVSSPAAPTVTTQGMTMINVSSPVHQMPAIPLNIQPGSILGQGQHQRVRAMQEANVARLAPVQPAHQNGSFERAQHMINSQNRRLSEASPPDAVYDGRQVEMIPVGSGRVVPVNYSGSSLNQNQASRGIPAWNGTGHPAPATSTPESLQQDLLNKIADIGESAEVEDTLVDLALANNPTLIQIFNAFQGNPSRFGRQAARLARSLMANNPTHQPAPAPVNGSIQANGNSSPRPVGQHQQLDMINGGRGPVNVDVQAGYGGSGEHFRTLSPAERHALNEQFRQLRILQMQQCVRLENCMTREMSTIPTKSVPQLHAAHNKAKKRMITTHAEQLRNLVFSLGGAQGVTALPQQ